MLGKSKLIIAISGTATLIAIAALSHLFGKTIAKSPHTPENAHLGMHQANTHAMPGHNPMEGDNVRSTHGNQASSADVRLLGRTSVTANTPNLFTLEVVNQSGQVVEKFDTFQEKLMHLIVVSDDLSFFKHLHPEYQGKGVFKVTANLPNPGEYTFFTDYKPSGQSEVISVVKAAVPGTVPAPVKPDLSQNRLIGNTTVGLALNPVTIKAGEPISLTFDLTDSSQNQPIQDLQPYLGELGHLVIIKQSANLNHKNYIHAHATTKKFSGNVNFTTVFPESGMYRLWGQFNRDGEIVTADFWLKVL